MAVKAFFSGVEGKSHFQACLDAGVKHVLTSYFQFYDKGNTDVVKQRKLANPDLEFLVDSGAHTMITDPAKFKTWSKTDFEDYVKGYAKWLEKNRQYIFAAVELDIDFCLNALFGAGKNGSLGPSIVESWQKRYFKPLEDLGMQIIYVWHVERKLEGWEEMCQKHAYVGLPGEMSSQSDFNKYMTVAKRYCSKVHGFAATKQTDYRDHPWYSIDSITWKTSEMYGALIDWDDHRQLLTFDDDKSGRAKYRHKFEKHGLDANGIIADTNYKDVTKYALISMRNMEKFYEQKYKARTFYYDLRIPVAQALDQMKFSEITELWKRLRPEVIFQTHKGETNPAHQRSFLKAISYVQNGKEAELSADKKAFDFLCAYFPKLLLPMVSDFTILQKELASYISPPNPPALARSERAHWIPLNNPPKARELEPLTLSELEHDVVSAPFISEEL